MTQICVLQKKKLRDRDLFNKDLQSQLEDRSDSESGPPGESQKSNIVIFHKIWAVAKKCFERFPACASDCGKIGKEQFDGVLGYICSQIVERRRKQL